MASYETKIEVHTPFPSPHLHAHLSGLLSHCTSRPFSQTGLLCLSQTSGLVLHENVCTSAPTVWSDSPTFSDLIVNITTKMVPSQIPNLYHNPCKHSFWATLITLCSIMICVLVSLSRIPAMKTGIRCLILLVSSE